MSFIDLFSEQSAQYAAARPTYPEALFDFVASLAPATERAWDCATGSGQAAGGLARRFDAVEATDASAEQIAHAIPFPGVRYSVQPAERTDFAPASFDAVCVAQALHWFDFAAFFPEVTRVLKNGGVFAAWGYDWMAVDPAFDAAFQESVLDVVAPRWAPQNQLLWDGYRDVPIPLERIATPEFNMQVSWNFPQLLAYVRTWSTVRRIVAEDSADFLQSAEAALLPLWGSASDARVIQFRLHVLAGRART
ncbi:hypothetical protein AYO41_02795 [Verrucomicrobia bacterium SCGC AG-212-E04]|nr:hypothetical protein AYO41_02795 [Verrucomicrobia bacterium SCGC AG-212-E04]